MVAVSVKVEPSSPWQVSVYIVFWLTALVAPEPLELPPVLILPLGFPVRVEHPVVSVVHQYSVAVFPFRTVVVCTQLGDAAVLKQPVGGEVVVLNVAVTVLLASSVTAQEPVPEHPPPDQPVKVEPAEGVVVRVMEVPSATVSLQSEPQLIPVPVTVPEPVPALLTVRV